MGPVGFFLFMLLIIGVVIVGVSSSNEATMNKNKKQNNRIAIKSGEIYGFSPTKEIYRDFSDYALYVDEIHKKVMFSNLLTNENPTYFFDELVECSILEDGATVNSVSVSGAIAGGLVGGDAGMILGGAKSNPVALSLSIRIITTNLQSPLQTIPIILSKMERTSKDYNERMQFTQEIYATITSIINQRNLYARNRSMRW